MEKQKKITNLLWTGGWDSTFRLMQLLISEKKSVQPYYILHESRVSTSLEIETMENIKKLLFERFPETEDLLRPTNYVEMSEIESDKEINDAYKEITSRQHLGNQYIALAEFCKQHNIYNIELGIHLRNHEESIDISIAQKVKNKMTKNENTIFKYFSFPLIDFSKKDMQEEARKHGWIDILKNTWFCHHPVYFPWKGYVPCGGCKPCTIAIQEGMSWRIPLVNQILGNFYKKVYHSNIFQRLSYTFKT